jgi:hypothetical protein
VNSYFDDHVISMFTLEQVTVQTIYTGYGGIRRTTALLEQKQQVAIQ